MDDGVPVDVIDLPEGSLLIAVDRREYGEAEVATDDMVLYPGDKAVVVAEHDTVDDVSRGIRRFVGPDWAACFGLLSGIGAVSATFEGSIRGDSYP